MRKTKFWWLIASAICLFPLAADPSYAQQWIQVTSCGSPPKTYPSGAAATILADQNGNLCANLVFPPSQTVTGTVYAQSIQLTNPWVVTGTVYTTVNVTVTTPQVQIATPLAINVPQVGAVVSGAFADGSLVTEGERADSAYSGSGAASIVSILKGIFANLVSPISVNVNGTPPVTGTVYAEALQVTNPWIVTGTTYMGGTSVVTFTNVNANILGTPTVTGTIYTAFVAGQTVGITGTPTVTGSVYVQQQTNPWVVTGTIYAGASNVTIGNVNPGTPAAWGLIPTGSAVSVTAHYIGAQARSSEPASASNGNMMGLITDLVGKIINSPYANRENYLRGAASTTASSTNVTLVSAQGANIKIYLTDLQCFRSDAGTSAIVVTLNDVTGNGPQSAFAVPNVGGGGGFIKSGGGVPLVFAANTTAQFANITTPTTTVYCNAQGYSGY